MEIADNEQLQQSIYLCDINQKFVSNTGVEDILAEPQTIFTPNQCPYQLSNFYTLWFLRSSLDKGLKVKGIRARPKVKSRSLHDIAHLHHQPDGFPDAVQKKILMVKITMARTTVK